MRTVTWSGGFAVAVGVSVSLAATGSALAQPPAAGAAPASSAAPVPTTGMPALTPPPAGAGIGEGATPATTPANASTAAVSTTDDTTPLRVPDELVEVHGGGITGEQAAVQAAATSYNARASEENVRAAEGRVDAAWAGFLPRLSGLGKYTRLSNFTSPSFIPAADLPPGITIPPIPFFVVNNWLVQGTLSVPISDYFLTIDQRYTAATKSADAARWDVLSQRAVSYSNGKVAYYTWLHNRALVIVAVKSLNDQKTHLRDARNQFAVGNASKADVLRAETSVASAELQVEQSSNLADISEKQVRVAMHLPEGQSMLPGEDLEAPVPPFTGNLQQMSSEALSARPELKSADANAASAREQAKAFRGQEYPNLSAFADGIVGNPNPRVIPPDNHWFATWDVGAQITWSPNDILVAGGNASDYDARAAATEANKGTTRDGIEVEVQQTWQAVREADFAIQSGTRELASAEEAYRVQRELFNNGRGTSTTLTDAETDLTRARLSLLNARADARIARVRLDHALGRDVKPAENSVKADKR